MMKQFKKPLVSLFVGAYLASSILSYAAFAYFAPAASGTTDFEQQVSEEEQQSLVGALLDLQSSEPKDQPCPLNGKLYTSTERQAWEQRRPLVVMIENSPDARPQSGLSRADIVFEAIAEGGVTRFMPIYYCGAQLFDTTLAPIRSARYYFVDWASGFNYPLYVNVGGANLPGPTNALGQIEQYGWGLQNNISQFSVGFPTFVRNAGRLGRPVATEHTMETSTEKLWAVAEARKWTNTAPARRIAGKAVAASEWQDGYTGWEFQEEAASAGSATTVEYDFWTGYSQYSAKWQYDADKGVYLRTMGGEPHLDLNNEEQIGAANVVVLLTQERGPVNELKHMMYKTIGAGEVLIFNNGTATKGRWSKQDREAELQFVDMTGQPIELARGLTWISVIDESRTVKY